MTKLIFDFDGTLVDSMEQWSDSMLNVLDKNKIEYPKDIIKTITPLGSRGVAEYFVENFGLENSVDELLETVNSYAYNAYQYDIVAKETVAETLKILKDRGYSLNVLTASPHKTLDVCLKNNKIYDLFDNVWSCDDFNTSKSDVNIYYDVAKKLETEIGNCIFFDDNLIALTVAKSSGMKIIGVYDKSSEEYTDKIIEVSNGYINKFCELLKYVD